MDSKVLPKGLKGRLIGDIPCRMSFECVKNTTRLLRGIVCIKLCEWNTVLFVTIYVMQIKSRYIYIRRREVRWEVEEGMTHLHCGKIRQCKSSCGCGCNYGYHRGQLRVWNRKVEREDLLKWKLDEAYEQIVHDVGGIRLDFLLIKNKMFEQPASVFGERMTTSGSWQASIVATCCPTVCW